ncbi:hypothetical protein B0T17DRAFT_203765 [Bombardia bombarda]|uniref:Uncharacterized protein n=1 Tax=Bombardia bombarda TaxID=252184 RepID=A0AA39XA61_9PEZI|nr:hypothetical protein B0T17DRAFT_203765 [Bombardia bombarda]
MSRPLNRRRISESLPPLRRTRAIRQEDEDEHYYEHDRSRREHGGHDRDSSKRPVADGHGRPRRHASLDRHGSYHRPSPRPENYPDSHLAGDDDDKQLARGRHRSSRPATDSHYHSSRRASPDRHTTSHSRRRPSPAASSRSSSSSSSSSGSSADSRPKSRSHRHRKSERSRRDEAHRHHQQQRYPPSSSRTKDLHQRERGDRTRSRSSSTGRDKDHPDKKSNGDIFMRAMQTAAEAGAMAALKLRSDPSPWIGAKGTKVAAAALGAAMVDTYMEQKHPEQKGGMRHNMMRQATQLAIGKLVVKPVVNKASSHHSAKAAGHKR